MRNYLNMTDAEKRAIAPYRVSRFNETFSTGSMSRSPSDILMLKKTSSVVSSSKNIMRAVGIMKTPVIPGKRALKV